MGKLQEITFQPVYFKTRNEIFHEFYKPCLESSIRYDRVTGYFGSSIFTVINEALMSFVQNKGRLRIICSPILTDDDFNAIREGHQLKLSNQNIDKMAYLIEEMSKSYPIPTQILSYLICNDILDIKLAVFGDNPLAYRLLHDKVGIFTDTIGDSVCFRGSVNETFQGLASKGNSESFDVDRSWGEDIEKYRVKIATEQFESIWNGQEPNIHTFEVPSITKDKFKSLYSENNLNELIEEIRVNDSSYKFPKWYAETSPKSRKVKDHQMEILENWEKKSYQGILKMCTGSGKTFTALCALRYMMFNYNKTPIVLVPSRLLFDQWFEELTKVFGENVAVLKCGNGFSPNSNLIRQYSMNINKKKIILSTYDFASKDAFIDSILQGEHLFLVADEVHNIGSNQNQKLMSLITGPRLGLSATPERYFDDLGTKKIFEYFKGIVEPQYTIQRAVSEDILTKYYYYINQVTLQEDEQEDWNRLTQQINQKILISKNLKPNTIDEIPGLEILLFKRADIVKKARSKIQIAYDVICKNYRDDHRWLIYLDDSEHVAELYNKLKENRFLKDKVFQYHTNTDDNLEDVLENYKQFGGILLSINCLDEGVDIPQIDHALILASSKNPRQYVQRRGRVLRKYPNKNFSYIYDFIVASNNLLDDETKGLSIIRSEVARAIEFAESAENKIYIKGILETIMIENGIDYNEGEFGINE